MVETIRAIGNHQGVIIDKSVLNRLGLQTGSPIHVALAPDGKGILLTPLTAEEASDARADSAPETSEAETTAGNQFYDDEAESEAQAASPERSSEVHSGPDPSAAGRFGRSDGLERGDDPASTPPPRPRREPAPEPEHNPLSAPNPGADVSNVPDAQDRLKRIFSEKPSAPRDEGPRYGRQEPSTTPGAGVPHSPIIRVVGVGGGGGNAVRTMITRGLEGVDVRVHPPGGGGAETRRELGELPQRLDLGIIRPPGKHSTETTCTAVERANSSW